MRTRSTLTAAAVSAVVFAGSVAPAAATPVPAAALLVEVVTVSGLDHAAPDAAAADIAAPGRGGDAAADGPAPVGWLLSEAALLAALGLAFIGAGTVAARRWSTAD